MQEDFPLVSIVVPVYNAGSTAAECIQSLLNQTYPHIEILLVDDGSHDNSLSILQDYAARDTRIRVFSQPNQGVAIARNLALANASGEYVQFVDSDDILPSSSTECMVTAMRAEGCDMVIARFYEVIKDKRRLRGYSKTDAILTREDLMQKLSHHPNSFYYGVLWNKLYRRDIICRHHITCDPSLPWGEDFTFNMQYMRYAERTAALAAAVYDYRRNLSGLAFSTGSRVIFHPIRAIKLKYDLYKQYRQLYQALGLWAAYRHILPRYLFGVTLGN